MVTLTIVGVVSVGRVAVLMILKTFPHLEAANVFCPNQLLFHLCVALCFPLKQTAENTTHFLQKRVPLLNNQSVGSDDVAAL